MSTALCSNCLLPQRSPGAGSCPAHKVLASYFEPCQTSPSRCHLHFCLPFSASPLVLGRRSKDGRVATHVITLPYPATPRPRPPTSMLCLAFHQPQRNGGLNQEVPSSARCRHFSPRTCKLPPQSMPVHAHAHALILVTQPQKPKKTPTLLRLISRLSLSALNPSSSNTRLIPSRTLPTTHSTIPPFHRSTVPHPAPSSSITKPV